MAASRKGLLSLYAVVIDGLTIRMGIGLVGYLIL
jgi:hypothetical protein